MQSATEHPLVSVILPIYNASPYLDQALNSVREQTLKDIEILCINDGSTDNSLEIIERHAAEDDRIVVIDKPNAGYGSGCNRGLDEAHGTWIAIVEPDDWIELGMYGDMLAYADSFDDPSSIDIVKTPYWRIWMPDRDNEKKMNCSYFHRIHPTREPFTIDDPGVVDILCHHPSIWSAIYRKSFLEEFGIRFHEIPGAGWADNPFLIETLCQARGIVYLEKAYYCYREETPEKSAAFAHRNTLIPMERWNDMKDILDRLNITDEGILRAHNSRGFTYLSGILEEVDFSHPEVLEAAKHMFSRMDDNLVFSDPEVSPGWKRHYAEIKGVECPPIDEGVYKKGLIKQGLYNLGNNGPGYTLYATRQYFAKYKKRIGRG